MAEEVKIGVTLKLKLFSLLQVIDGATTITPLLRPRAQRLLAYLLLQRHTPLMREHIAFSLWPDHPEKAALGSLRRALSELRAALPAPTEVQWIIDASGELHWNPDGRFWLDVELFEHLIRQTTITSLHDAAMLYTGELLAEWDDEWVRIERERLRQLQLNSLRQLASHHRALGEVETALGLTRRALELDPLAETVYRNLIALHYEAGDRAAALAEYERLRTLMHDELGAEPMAETEALRLAIIQGKPLPIPEIRLATPVPSKSPDLPKLFGRKAEMAELTALWQEAVAGQGRFVIVSGEAGVGKSHLVLKLADHVRRQSGLVLVGHCYEFEQALPFQAIVEMLRAASDLLRHLDLPAAHRAALAHLAPDVLGAAGSQPVELGGSSSQLRLQLFEALLQAFLLLAHRQPLLLIFEDVHWAAESTLDWLTYIAPRLGASNLLVLITYRIHEVDAQHTLARLERRLAREGTVSSFPLQPLSRDTNRALVGHLSGLDEQRTSRLADWLFLETGGNPFFLHELVRGLIETGQIKVSHGQWQGTLVEATPGAEILLPDSVRETISARVERLSEMSRMFIRTAAIAGRVFPYNIVRQAGGWAEEWALDALEDLLARGFLHPGESEGSFTFSHHLVQEAIYAGLTPPRRIYLHRQLAGAIQALRPHDVEALVHHFIASGEREQAIEYALQAAQRADAMYAYEEAVTYRLTALEQLESQDNLQLRLILLEELADDYRLLREGATAVSTYQAALDLWQSSKQADKIIAVRLYRKILQTTAGMWGHADYEHFESASQVSERLRARLNTVLSIVDDEPPHPEKVRLLKALANDALIIRYPRDWDEALNYAQAAVATAEQLETPVILSSALATLASVYGARGMVRERVQIALRQLELSRDPHFANPRQGVRILNGIGSALVHAGEYKQAINYLQEAETLADEIRAVDLQSQALSLLHQCWFRLDQWDEMAKLDQKRNKLIQQHSLERLGSPCFAIALSAATHARRGSFNLAQSLREQSYAIMTNIHGSPERWARSQHY